MKEGIKLKMPKAYQLIGHLLVWTSVRLEKCQSESIMVYIKYASLDSWRFMGDIFVNILGTILIFKRAF